MPFRASSTGIPRSTATAPNEGMQPRRGGAIGDAVHPDRRDRSGSSFGGMKKMPPPLRSGTMSGNRRTKRNIMIFIAFCQISTPCRRALARPRRDGERHHKHTSRVHVEVAIAEVVELRAPCPWLDPENVPRTAKSRPSARDIEAASAVPAGGAGCSWGREQISLRPGGGHVVWPLYKSQIAGAERAGIPFGELDEVECGQVLRA